MAVWEKLYQLINWQNKPSRTTPLGRSKLSILDEAVDGIDDRVIELHTTVETQSTDLDNKVDKYKTITTSTDLNTILESGFYSIPDGCTNIPAMQGGGKATLIVVVHPYGASSGQVLQILVNQLNVNSTDKMYYRIGTIGTQTTSFLDWNRVLNLDDIPTIASAIKQWYTGSYTINLYGIGLPGTYYPASSTYSGNRYLDVATGIMYDCEQTGPSTYTWRQAPVNLRLKTDINASAISDIQEDISQSLSATGNPLTIEAAEANLVKCVAEVEAYQEGSGEPSPDNIRPIIGQTEVVIDDVGKNLCDEGLLEIGGISGDSHDKGYSTTWMRGTKAIFLSSGTYNLSSLNFIGRISNVYEWSAEVIRGGNFVRKIIEHVLPCSFTLTESAYISFEISVGRTVALDDLTNSNIQLELGSTASDFEPYKGKTYRVEIGQKNKLPMTVDGIKSANTSGSWSGNVYTINGGTIEILTDLDNNVIGFKVNGTFTATVWFVTAPTFTLDANTYIISGASNNVGLYGEGSTAFADWNSTNATPETQKTFTSDATGRIYLRASATQYSNEIVYPMIRTTIDDSEFVPYNPNLPDAIYGGELDVITGELTVTHGEVDLGDLSYNYTSNWNGAGVFESTPLSDYKIVNDNTKANVISENYETVSHNTLYNNPTLFGVATSGEYNNKLYIRDSRYNDATTFKTAVTGQTLVYELATPYTIQLTPQQIRMLKGTNNISCNTGDLTIKYYPDNVLGQLKGDIESEYDERIESLEEKAVNALKIKSITTSTVTNQQGVSSSSYDNYVQGDKKIIPVSIIAKTTGYDVVDVHYVLDEINRLIYFIPKDLTGSAIPSGRTVSMTIYYFEI